MRVRRFETRLALPRLNVHQKGYAAPVIEQAPEPFRDHAALEILPLEPRQRHGDPVRPPAHRVVSPICPAITSEVMPL